MKIQSLSIVVPNKGCINDCKFCCAKMHTEDYKNQLDANLPFYDLYIKDYLKRLEYARDNGCNTVMLTGNSEPQQNRQFLMMFGLLNQMLSKPFRIIEMQTTGTLLDRNYLRFLRNHVGVSTISLSLSSFDSILNADICGMKKPVDIYELCSLIKEYDFNLRLSLNISGVTPRSLDTIFDKCIEVGADQVTFRKLYTSGEDTPQDKWIANNLFVGYDGWFDDINSYIAATGKLLNILEYGQKQYSVCGMSVVVDDDCMSQQAKESMKYLILRPDCKLYSKWDDKSSLIF